MPSPIMPTAPGAGQGAAGKASAPQPAPEQPAPAKPGLKRGALAGTMIGMPSPVVPGERGAAPPAAAPPEQTPSPKPNFGKTMVGVGSPGIMTPAREESPAPAPAPAGSQAATPQPAQQSRKFQGTLLGVARPGIAPAADAPAPPAPPASRPAQVSSTPALPSEPAPQPFPTTRPLWKNVLMVAGGMAVAAGIGGIIAVFAPKPVTVVVQEFSIDEEGNDRLKLKCQDCPEGSTLILGDAQAKVENKGALLTPKQPLSLGRNELEFVLKHQDELTDVKKVILPIAFRVLTNWKGAHESPPYAEIVVAAPEGSEVKIAGNSLPLKGEKAVHQVSFEEEASGESSKTEKVERQFAVLVNVDGKERKTSAELRSAITPLTLASPSAVHQLGGKPVAIAGRTSKNAKITIGETEIEADDKGSFSYSLESPAEGSVTVIARGEKLLARRVTLELTKNASVPEGALTKFSEVEPGATVYLRANVIESRTAAGATRALLEVENGCEAPPCLVRAVYAEPKKLAPNRPIRVSGTVAGGSPLTIKVRRFH